MADSQINYYLAQGTHAGRLGFTPSPPAAIVGQPAFSYLWFETDTGDLYAYNTGTSAWQYAGSAVNAIFVNANVSLSPGQFVTFEAGGVGLADATDDTKPAIGFVLQGVSASATAAVRLFGLNTGITGLTAPGYVYLGTAGGYTTTRPTTGALQILGSITPGGNMLFQPGPASLLG